MTDTNEILMELRDNLCDDFNLEDPSVGSHSVYEIDERIVQDLNERDSIKVISYSKHSAILNVDGYLFELYLHVDEHKSYWDIREAG